MDGSGAVFLTCAVGAVGAAAGVVLADWRAGWLAGWLACAIVVVFPLPPKRCAEMR